MYSSWIVGHYWYGPPPAEDLSASRDPFPGSIDAAQATYVVVVGRQELRTERRLPGLTRNLPVVASTDRFVVFDARGGRHASCLGFVDLVVRAVAPMIVRLQKDEEQRADHDQRDYDERGESERLEPGYEKDDGRPPAA